MTETFSIGEMVDESILAYAREHEFSELLGVDIPEHELKYSANYGVSPDMKTPYLPEVADLVRLHQTVRSRKAFTVLEFGVGYSTVILADAIARNEAEFKPVAGDHPQIRRNNPFELHSVDASEEYLKIVRERIPKRLQAYVHLTHSECSMGTFQDRVCHYYDRLPNVSPDFIYLDAPGQYDIAGEVRGISTRHQDRLPMSADLAAIEYFLLPGTMILVDGRTANARFLRDSFQRNWDYHHDASADVHTFELVEEPLGTYNAAALRFCLGERYFSRLREVSSGT